MYNSIDKIYWHKDLLEPFATWIHEWYCNEKYTPMAQVIVAFAWGVLLSPWSSGLFWLVILIIINWILYYIIAGKYPRHYNVFVRTGVMFSSIFGYILGRTLSCDLILMSGLENES